MERTRARTAPRSKIDAVKRYGAEVVILSWKDTSAYLEKPPSDRCFIHPLAEYGLMDGHGTIGLENMEDAPDTETIFVALGGGFLGAGVALAAKTIKPSVSALSALPQPSKPLKKKEVKLFVFLLEEVLTPINWSRLSNIQVNNRDKFTTVPA